MLRKWENIDNKDIVYYFLIIILYIGEGKIFIKGVKVM